MLKKVVLSIQLVIIGFSLSAQLDAEKEKALYGFSLGINRSSLEFNESTRLKEDKGVGLRLGINAEYKLVSNLYIMPRAELASYQNTVEYAFEDAPSQEYELMPLSLELKANFAYKFCEGKSLRPYFLAGSSYIYSIEQNLKNIEYPNKSTITVDVGIGLERKFDHFFFSPEFRYSHGLNDINENPFFSNDIKFHNFSVVLIFKG